jgi:hypothetical protein
MYRFAFWAELRFFVVRSRATAPAAWRYSPQSAVAGNQGGLNGGEHDRQIGQQPTKL